MSFATFVTNLPTKLGSALKAASVPVTIATDDAQFGAGGTGIAEPAGGSGLLGWLSGIYKAITGTLTVTRVAADSTGAYHFDPDSMPHTYTYDGSGNIATDSVTDGTNTFKKTYTFTGSQLTSETAWVKQ